MNHKETLYFIAKCLTISLEAKNRQEIEKQLKSKNIDWDAFVKVSTAHYVFSALYCNFKRADFLKYLPADLVEYMKYLTCLNRDRNIQIIKQAYKLNSILLENNITPIFLKGTGNLLAGIYEDIAERMVGDIDLILLNEDCSKAISVLREFGYDKEIPLGLPHRHYPRIIRKDSIAGVEIHKDLLEEKFVKEFNYSFVIKDIQVINETSVLSYANKLNLSIIANQINDSGFYYKTMALRNAYDVFLLSKKTNAMAAVNTLDKLTNPLNCFLAVCYEVFNKVDSLEYNTTKKTLNHLKDFNNQFTNPKVTIIHYKIKKSYLLLKFILNIIYKSLTQKVYRVWLFKKLSSLNYKREG
ncbi:nucleotidyltransferase family protein [Flavobacteriaceae bacterium]|nr:nucleotidyltransferase family protein [Flavobacteriaceae bacterium]